MPEETKKKLSAIYEFAREHSPLYAALPPMPVQWTDVPITTKESMRAAASLSAYPESDIRYLVSEFTTEHPENLFLVPRRIDERWPLVEAEMDMCKPFVAVFLAPLFWQVAPVFYTTFRSKKVPVSVLAPRNLPLAVQVIKEARADMAISTPAIAKELQPLLVDAGLGTAIRAWHLIVPFSTQAARPALTAPYMVEYHLFPGIPVARELPDGTLEPLADYYFEIGEQGTCLISSLEKHALPLVRYDSGVRVTKRDGNTFLFA